MVERLGETRENPAGGYGWNSMQLTQTAFGMWSAGRFMHYGEPYDYDRFIDLIRFAYEKGIRTFVTADVYGAGEADALLGRALEGIPRDSYCLVGAAGHDFYEGEREGSKGFSRFTNAALRKPGAFADYLRAATEKSLARCQIDRFDLLLLHNTDATGYTSDAVWKGMDKLKDAGLTNQLGIAPGPANGFTLDLILAFEQRTQPECRHDVGGKDGKLASPRTPTSYCWRFLFPAGPEFGLPPDL